MRHPDRVWTDQAYAGESLDRLAREYVEYRRGRAEKVSPETVEKYRKVLLSFRGSLERSGEPLVLASVTPAAVNRWVSEQRALHRAEEGIANRLSALKVFTRKFVLHHLELTTVDLLAKVPRISVGEQPVPMLSEAEIGRVLGCFDRGTYGDVRDQAFVCVLLSTGLRFKEVWEMTVSGLDRVSGEFVVRAKGDRLRPVRMSPRALKLVRRYLQVRPTGGGSDRLWLTDEGEPLTYWGAQAIFRRAKRKSGVARLHAHLLRHTFAQGALKKGAPRAEVQDMLGHVTDAMTRRYTGTIRQEVAAANMPRYSLV